MATFVLAADTVNGVQKIELLDFLSDNPEQAFVPAQEFIEYLKDLGEGELVAALFDPLVHAEYYDAVAKEYGIETE